MRIIVLVIINFLLSILLGSVLSSFIEAFLVQLLIKPIVNIVMALLATRSPLWAPIIVYISGLLYTVSYSLYNSGKFIVYKRISDVFTDLTFISAMITLIITLGIYFSRKEMESASK